MNGVFSEQDKERFLRKREGLRKLEAMELQRARQERIWEDPMACLARGWQLYLSAQQFREAAGIRPDPDPLKMMTWEEAERHVAGLRRLVQLRRQLRPDALHGGVAADDGDP